MVHLGGSVGWASDFGLVPHDLTVWLMTSQFVGSSPASGYTLSAQSLEPASDSGSPSLSAPPPLTLCLSKINTCKKKILISNLAWADNFVKYNKNK